MPRGTHDALPDPRNADVQVYINGTFYPRDEAKISVFDSGYLVGDGIWEGLRLYNGRFAFLDRHLDRLFMGAKAIDLDIGKTREELTQALRATAEKNGMTDGAHVRLMITRGTKKTPSQDPRLTVGGPTIVIIAGAQTRRPGHEAGRRAALHGYHPTSAAGHARPEAELPQ